MILEMAYKEYVAICFTEAHNLCHGLKAINKLSKVQSNGRNFLKIGRWLPEKRTLAYRLSEGGRWVSSASEKLCVLFTLFLLFAMPAMPSDMLGSAFLFQGGFTMLVCILGSANTKFLSPYAEEERSCRSLLAGNSRNSRSTLFNAMIDTLQSSSDQPSAALALSRFLDQ